MAVSYVNGTSFNVYSLDEIRKLSVKQIKVATAYDSLGHPVVGCVLLLWFVRGHRCLLALWCLPSLDHSLISGCYVCRGLYDPALGPLELGALCTTCKLTSDDCPGHCGHIEMVVPVYNPVFFPQMFNILKRKCFHCHK